MLVDDGEEDTGKTITVGFFFANELDGMKRKRYMTMKDPT